MSEEERAKDEVWQIRSSVRQVRLVAPMIEDQDKAEYLLWFADELDAAAQKLIARLSALAVFSVPH